MHEITNRLKAARDGDRDALQQVFEIIYRELRALARRELARRPVQSTLNPTALVHEVYLKLIDRSRPEWNDRRHLLSVAAMAMRQLVVDHARRKLARRRGAGAGHVPVSQTEIAVDHRLVDALILDEALGRLSKLSARLARVVELRFFGGLSVEETAEVLDVTPRTVKRDWRKARALLLHEIEGGRG